MPPLLVRLGLVSLWLRLSKSH